MYNLVVFDILSPPHTIATIKVTDIHHLLEFPCVRLLWGLFAVDLFSGVGGLLHGCVYVNSKTT